MVLRAPCRRPRATVPPYPLMILRTTTREVVLVSTHSQLMILERSLAGNVTFVILPTPIPPYGIAAAVSRGDPTFPSGLALDVPRSILTSLAHPVECVEVTGLSRSRIL